MTPERREDAWGNPARMRLGVEPRKYALGFTPRVMTGWLLPWLGISRVFDPESPHQPDETSVADGPPKVAGPPKEYAVLRANLPSAPDLSAQPVVTEVDLGNTRE
jgi:hypothetical protein